VAVELLGSEDLVWSVLRDPESSPLEEREKVLFRFVEKVHSDASSVSDSDMERLHAAGWDDEAIYIAITVCALFNFYNRWVDANGVHALSDEGHREGGRRMAEHGYVRK
jgi:alkylhydroperoxidase family enzyme